MKLMFVTLMLHMLNFGSNSVEQSCSAVVIGIQSSDFVHQIAIGTFRTFLRINPHFEKIILLVIKRLQ